MAKAGIDIGGTTLLERSLSVTEGAARTVCVGPRRATSRSLVWTREQPVGGGPVAGLAAGLTQVTASVVVVLAVDHPFVTQDLVRLLVSKASPAAWLVDEDGRPQPLVAAYATEELTRRLDEIGDPRSVPMQRLVEGLPHVTVEDSPAARDCDTWDTIEWARSRISIA